MKLFIFFFLHIFYNKVYCIDSFCPFMSSKEWIYKQKTWNNNKVIYKCITNNYDNSLKPKYLNYDYDYILFSDNYFNDDYSIWEFYPIPNEVNKLNLSAVKIERYIKINAHKCLPSKYNFSIFIDGNIIIKNDINLLINELEDKLGKYQFYVPQHPQRNCLYEEIQAVLDLKKDTFSSLFPQIEKFIKDGFPHKFGLPETNVLIRYHLKPNIIKLMNDWWKILYSGSHRDQLSFSYVAWKNINIKFAYFNNKIYKQYFLRIPHKKIKRKK